MISHSFWTTFYIVALVASTQLGSTTAHKHNSGSGSSSHSGSSKSSSIDCPHGTVWNKHSSMCVHDCKLPKKCSNPCSPKAIKHGKFYHEHCKDEDKFVQCDEFGGCFVMPCAPGTIWSQEHQVCVHDGGSASSKTKKTSKSKSSKKSIGYDCEKKNPCKHGNPGYYQHKHNHKFVQCDDFGGCFEMDCPRGTVWSQKYMTCVHD